MTEFDFMQKSDKEQNLMLLNEKIKTKTRMLYLYFFCFVCWSFSAIGNMISGHTFASILNLLCMFCWGYISLICADTVSKLNKEKEDIIKQQNLKNENSKELDSLDFFSKIDTDKSIN